MKEVEEQSLNGKPTRSPPPAMELEGQRAKKKKPLYKRPCCIVTTTVIFLLIIILIILIFTVFKVREPEITLTSVSVSGVSPRVSLPAIRIELNITLDLKLSIRNKNYVSFKYGQAGSLVFYNGDQVGDVAISPGKMKSRSTADIDARLTIEADRVDMRSLIADVLDQLLSFEIRTRIPGRATILGFIKKHVVATSTCQVDIQLSSMTVARQQCKTKAKL